MRTRVCTTVTAASTTELRRRRDEAADADLVELRLDTVSDPNVAGALADRRGPVIVTCRAAWEGGAFAGSEEERRRLLGDALALGAEFVDIEWRAGFDDLVSIDGGRRIVLSSHEFGGVPADLEARLRAMRATGAGVAKLAVQTTRLADTLPLFELGPRASREGGVVLLGMGEAGLATRILASRIGSAWTYAGDQREIGQLPAAALVGQYRIPRHRAGDRAVRHRRAGPSRIRCRRPCTTPLFDGRAATRCICLWPRPTSMTSSRSPARWG